MHGQNELLGSVNQGRASLSVIGYGGPKYVEENGSCTIWSGDCHRLGVAA